MVASSQLHSDRAVLAEAEEGVRTRHVRSEDNYSDPLSRETGDGAELARFFERMRAAGYDDDDDDDLYAFAHAEAGALPQAWDADCDDFECMYDAHAGDIGAAGKA